jgi:hypothetical protein
MPRLGFNWGMTKPPPGSQIDWGHPLAPRDGACWILNHGAGRLSPELLSGQGGDGFQNHAYWRGQGVWLDGTDDWISAGDILNGIVVPFSVSARVYMNSTTGSRAVFHSDSGDANLAGFYLQRYGTRLDARYGDNTGTGSGNYRRFYSPDTILGAVGLYEFTAVVRGPTDASLYLNGVSQGATATGTGGVMVHTSSPAAIGRGGPSGGLVYWLGDIRRVIVYPWALTAVEVAQLAAQPYSFIAPPSSRRWFVPAPMTAWTKALTDTATISDAIAKFFGKYSGDAATPSDALVKSFGKRPADTVNPSDALAKAVGKRASDGVTISDVIAKFFGKGASDAVTPSDAIAKAVGKRQADTVTPSEALSKRTGKRETDSVTASDAIRKAAGKHLSDTATPTDIFSRTVLWVRTFADTVTVADVCTRVFSGAAHLFRRTLFRRAGSRGIPKD